MKVYAVAEVDKDGGIGKIHGERNSREEVYGLLDQKLIDCPNLDFGIWEYSIERIDV